MEKSKMTDYELLMECLSRTPFLRVDADEQTADLIAQTDALQTMISPREFGPLILFDLATALKRFSAVRSVGTKDRHFSATEVATIVGIDRTQFFRWCDMGLAVASIPAAIVRQRKSERKFTYRDAFLNGVLGSMRRAGAGLNLLRVIAKTLDAAVPAEEEALSDG
jgi:hypothetical protein